MDARADSFDLHEQPWATPCSSDVTAAGRPVPSLLVKGSGGRHVDTPDCRRSLMQHRNGGRTTSWLPLLLAVSRGIQASEIARRSPRACLHPTGPSTRAKRKTPGYLWATTSHGVLHALTSYPNPSGSRSGNVSHAVIRRSCRSAREKALEQREAPRSWPAEGGDSISKQSSSRRTGAIIPRNLGFTRLRPQRCDPCRTSWHP